MRRQSRRGTLRRIAGSDGCAYLRRLGALSRFAFPYIREAEYRSGILHSSAGAAVQGLAKAAWIGGDVNGPAIGADRSIAIAILGLEVAGHVTADLLSVGREGCNVKRATLQRGDQKNLIPTGDSCSVRGVVLDAGGAGGGPADEVDSSASRVVKIEACRYGEHGRDRLNEWFGEGGFRLARHRRINRNVAESQLRARRAGVCPTGIFIGFVVLQAGNVRPTVVGSGF